MYSWAEWILVIYALLWYNINMETNNAFLPSQENGSDEAVTAKARLQVEQDRQKALAKELKSVEEKQREHELDDLEKQLEN